jgi:hypothetical protein
MIAANTRYFESLNHTGCASFEKATSSSRFITLLSGICKGHQFKEDDSFIKWKEPEKTWVMKIQVFELLNQAK